MILKMFLFLFSIFYSQLNLQCFPHFKKSKYTKLRFFWFFYLTSSLVFPVGYRLLKLLNVSFPL